MSPTARTSLAVDPGAQAPSPQRGFTLLELTVASFVAMVVLLLAVDTLRVSLQSVVIVGDEARLPSREWPLTLLRRDVRRAAGFVGFSAGWTTAPLVLENESSRIVFWRADDGHLRRSYKSTAPGSAADQGIVLQGATTWQWRSLSAEAVQVRLGVSRRRPRADAWGARRERVEELVLTRRAGVRVGRW